jgi:hypothetical protein
MTTMSTEPTKSSDGGFLGGMFLGTLCGMLLGGMLMLAALLSVPGL